jgi:hypothetical protein
VVGGSAGLDRRKGRRRELVVLQQCDLEFENGGRIVGGPPDESIEVGARRVQRRAQNIGFRFRRTRGRARA